MPSRCDKNTTPPCFSPPCRLLIVALLTPAQFNAAAPAVAAAWARAAAAGGGGGPTWRVDALRGPFAGARGGCLLALVGADGRDGVVMEERGDEAAVEPVLFAADDDDDGASLPPPPLPPPRLHAHVSYAPCYAAPVLLVRGVDGGGAPLPLAAVDAALPAAAAAAGAPVSPPPVAPADHPAPEAGGGWGALHPCGGGAVAGEVAGGGGDAPAEGRLAAWLSLAAGAAGVRVPLLFAREVCGGKGGGLSVSL